MKKLILCSFMLVVLSVMIVNAQGTKVGVVDADVVIQKSVKGKKFFADYEKFTRQKRQEIDAMADQYRTRQKDVQAKAASMSEDKRTSSALELQRMQKDIKRAQEDATRESKTRLNTGLDQFQKELAPVIRQVALEKGLDLVFNYGPQSGIVFIGEKINITQDVIRKYDSTSR